MPFKRPSPKVLDSLEGSLADVNEKLRQMQTIEKARDSDFWKIVHPKLKAKLGYIESQLDNYLKLTPEHRISLLEQRLNLRFFAGIIDDMTHDLPLMEKRKEKLIEKIQEYRGKLRKV